MFSECGTPSDPMFGVAVYSDTVYLSVVTYDGIEGYECDDSQRTCNASGVWNSTEATCTPVGRYTHLQTVQIHLMSCKRYLCILQEPRCVFLYGP